MVRYGGLILLGLLMASQSAMAMTGQYYTRIMEIVNARDLKALKQLRSMGIDMNSPGPNGMTPLCGTIVQGDYEGYELLLTQGASPYVSCVRQLPQRTVAEFYANQPAPHTFYNGHFTEAAPVGGWGESGVKGFDFPTLGVGEILLGGVAVGAALALGHGGSSGSSSGGDDNDYVWTAPLKLEAKSFETSEYKADSFNNSIDFLGQVKASSAYARGYTGYKVNRKSDGTLIGAGEKAISTDKVKVAVVDEGVWVMHPDLKANIGTGYNFVYGVCSANNAAKCWQYNETEGVAYLYENWTPSSTVNDAIDSKELPEWRWAIYSQKYANYSYEATNPKPHIAPTWVVVDTSGQVHRYDRFYTEEAGEKVWWLDTGATVDGQRVLAKVTCTESDTEGNCVAGTSLLGSVTAQNDLTNHGTHVAGIIGATKNDEGMMGVAYNVDIVPVKIDFDMQSHEGISKAVELADITNLSLASSANVRFEDKAAAVSAFDTVISTANYKRLLDVYRTAAKQNKILVFAAGNYDHSSDEKPYDPSWYTIAPLSDMFNGKKRHDDGNTYNLKNLLVTVVALNNKLDGLASYSAQCGLTKDYCIAAPGGDESKQIYSTVLKSVEADGPVYGYGAGAGTSMATPIVSGALAVIKGAFPHLTNQQVVQILLETATDLGEPGVDEVYGHGLLNLEAATNPVGLQKIVLSEKASGENVAAASSSSTIPAVFAGVSKALPTEMIVLDKFDRAFQVPTDSFVRVAKRENKQEGRFKSFMRGNEKVVADTDKFTMAYSERRSDVYSQMVHGSMSLEVRPTTAWRFKTFYTENTETTGGTYFERLMLAPYAKMKEAWGSAISYDFGKNWQATVSGQVGQNGFVDEDDLHDMDHNKASVFQSTLQYNGLKKVGLKMVAGVSNEQGSTLGMWGKGAFKSSNSRTTYVGAGVTLNLTDAVTIEGMYYSGVTHVNNGNSLVKMSNLKSDSFAVTAAWNVNDKRTIGMQFVSPLRVRKGVATVNLPVARDAYQDVVYRDEVHASLKPTAREYDVGFYYTDALQEDVHFQSEFGVRLNPDHVAGAAPDWRALVGLHFGL